MIPKCAFGLQTCFMMNFELSFETKLEHTPITIRAPSLGPRRQNDFRSKRFIIYPLCVPGYNFKSPSCSNKF